jgi:membrane protein implicated in regulation of membrane protease activity
MSIHLHLGGDILLGIAALAGLSALLLTALLLAAVSHPILASVAIMLTARALERR